MTDSVNIVIEVALDSAEAMEHVLRHEGVPYHRLVGPNGAVLQVDPEDEKRVWTALEQWNRALSSASRSFERGVEAFRRNNKQ